MAHMDNSSYADQSSLSDTVDSHDAALLLFQDATLNKPLDKSSVSSTGLIYPDPILRKTSCQEVHLANEQANPATRHFSSS